MRVWRGRPYPQGATCDGDGANIAVFAEHTNRVELCLFDLQEAGRELSRPPLPYYTDLVWQAYLPESPPGPVYGFRVHGPHEPQHGRGSHPNKVLRDPYAEAVGRRVDWHDRVCGCQIKVAGADRVQEERA